MRTLSSTKSHSKRAEATTDESQLSASSWRNTLKLLHRPWGSIAALARHRRQQRQQRQQRRKQQELKLYNQQLFEDDAQTVDSNTDLFQTLMSNSAAAPICGGPDGAISSSNNRYGKDDWHTVDPNFLPTAYPLTRTDPRSHPKARWGSLNLAASAALLAQPLRRFNAVTDKLPPFRFGPKPAPGADKGDTSSSDGASIASGRSRSALDMSTPKYSYVVQDGKLVEREVRNWPRLKEPKLTLRYKLSEPYATNYGKKSQRRARSVGERIILPRHRWIYERPIYLVPRSIVNENKQRLIARHMLKDRLVATDSFRLPNKVSIGESELGRRCFENQAVKVHKQSEELVAHLERLRSKTTSPTSHS